MGRSTGKNKRQERSSTSRARKKEDGGFLLISKSKKEMLNQKFTSGHLYKLDDDQIISSNNGVYGIFYTKPAGIYKKLIDDPAKEPVYVGKAGASGLSNRLKQHLKSIESVDMNPDNFRCRALEMDSEADTVAAEMILIDMHKPLWNTILKGFGNKNVGSARTNQTTSRWDTIHIGRDWVKAMQPRQEDAENLKKEMRLFVDFKKYFDKKDTSSFDKSDWLQFLNKEKKNKD